MKHTTLITLILALIVSASVAQVHMHIDSLTFKGAKEIKITKMKFVNSVKSNSPEIGRIKKKHVDSVAKTATQWSGKIHARSTADTGLYYINGLITSYPDYQSNDLVWNYGNTPTFKAHVTNSPINKYQVVVMAQRTVLTITDPDSLGVVTVCIHKSQVHFINDSTFTFKEN